MRPSAVPTRTQASTRVADAGHSGVAASESESRREPGLRGEALHGAQPEKNNCLYHNTSRYNECQAAAGDETPRPRRSQGETAGAAAALPSGTCSWLRRAHALPPPTGSTAIAPRAQVSLKRGVEAQLPAGRGQGGPRGPAPRRRRSLLPPGCAWACRMRVPPAAETGRKLVQPGPPCS